MEASGPVGAREQKCNINIHIRGKHQQQKEAGA